MARSFNGTSDKIVGASATPINFDFNNTFSAACWAYLNVTNAEQEFIGHLDTANNFRGWELQYNSGGTDFHVFIINTYPSNSIEVGTHGGITVKIKRWYHVGFSYDGSHTAAGVSIYVDGVKITNSVTNDSLTTTATNSIVPQIGVRNNATDFMNGSLADIAVWNTNLGQTDFTNLAAGRRPTYVQNASLVAWWPLDGYASPEPDLSGNSNNGTLTGTAGALGPAGLWRLSA